MELAPELRIAPVSERYAVEAYLGRGATSLVFKAFDRRNRITVALKSLAFPQGEDILRFKREFRDLSALSHRNIVSLYDLYVDPPQCYFTMEYVEGKDFVTAVRRGGGANRTVDFTALNANTSALVEALLAVHAIGRVHLDIKPSNVLVSHANRVVVLDFGLSALAGSRASSRAMAGTLAYMCPEHAAGAPPSPRFDWYALGVMLFESITGAVPIAAPSAAMVMAVAPECPGYLADLIGALTAPRAEQQPDGSMILRTLNAHRGRAARRAAGRAPATEFSTIGREGSLEVLNAALRRTLQGAPHLITVAGESGVGKSSLVEHFTSTSVRDSGALMLCSRCHYQETIRSPALDGIIDGLAEFLADDVLLAPRVSAFEYFSLRRLFPVLEAVRFDVQGRLEGEPLDPFVLIEHALAALCRILVELSASRSLVLWIDDYQWADANSGPFVRRILETTASRILVVISYHPESRSASLEQLDALRASGEALAGRVSHVFLKPLSVEESAAFFADLSGAPLSTEEERASLAQGTGGLPIFIREIARHGWGDDQELRRFDPAIALSQRLHSLSPAAHEVLALTALCDLPMDEAALLSVDGISSDAKAAVTSLCQGHFLKKIADKEGSRIAVFHDRIRRAVVGLLQPERKRLLHKRIADVLMQSPNPDLRAVVAQLLGAELTTQASGVAVLAARQEANRLNFATAADFLALAIQHEDASGQLSDMHAELGMLLANAGASRKAAQAYLRSLETLDHSCSPRLHVAQLKVHAAEQFLCAGLLASGIDLLRNVFADLSLPYPHDQRSATRTATLNRLLFALRVGRAAASPAGNVPAETLLRLDTLWVAAKGTCMLDYVVGDAMASWYLRESVEAREPTRLLRAVGLEASIYANVGGRGMLKRSAAMMTRARQLLSHANEPANQAFVYHAEATVAWFKGEWRQSASVAEQAIAIYRSSCQGVQFEVAILLGWALTARAFVGEIDHVRGMMPGLLADARKRGDEYFFDVFRSSFLGYLVAAADDNCEAAMKVVNGSLHKVPKDRFTSLHFHHLIAATNLLLYLGEAQRAWDLIESKWPEVAGTGFLRLAALSTFLRELRSRAAIAACSCSHDTSQRQRLLSIARKDARCIQATDLPFAGAMAAAIDSMVAGVEGKEDAQTRLVGLATAGYRSADMELYAEALTHRFAKNKRMPPAEAFMAREQIRNPSAFATMFYPAPVLGAA
ncbi:serine/threonine-protein kinase [Piscinibacter koreensis]|uniref:Protein kinase n=1 Tax=Piscinibacter koreensis TaxID=2742824 RepID=A0A7Y6TWC9_9BURK|nr:serine/threonine-protein kinase [Schlegelella koreensis]NUZ05913.1 protein kinase [Schlegelella koreensis]